MQNSYNKLFDDTSGKICGEYIKNGKLQKESLIKQYKCCLNTCKNLVEYSREYCKKGNNLPDRCEEKAKNIVKLCGENCDLMMGEHMNKIDFLTECVIKEGCTNIKNKYKNTKNQRLKSLLINKKCLKKKEKRIKECCYHNCKDIECRKFCNFGFSYLLDKSLNNPLCNNKEECNLLYRENFTNKFKERFKEKLFLNKSEYKNKEKTTSKLFFIFIVIILFVISVWIILKYYCKVKKKSK